MIVCISNMLIHTNIEKNTAQTHHEQLNFISQKPSHFFAVLKSLLRWNHEAKSFYPIEITFALNNTKCNTQFTNKVQQISFF